MTPDGGTPLGSILPGHRGLRGIGVPNFETVNKMGLLPFKWPPNPAQIAYTSLRNWSAMLSD
jgi:hypothetical protein